MALPNSLASAESRPSPDRGLAALGPLFAPYLRDQPSEIAIVAGFDCRAQLVCFVETRGSASDVDDILPAFRSVMAQLSVSEIVLAHNHPDAAALSSPRDRATTERLTALARLAGIWLADHLIFGRDGIYSMRASQLMPHLR